MPSLPFPMFLCHFHAVSTRFSRGNRCPSAGIHGKWGILVFISLVLPLPFRFLTLCLILRFLRLRFLPLLSSSSSISSSEVLPRRRDESDGLTEGDVCKGNNYGVQLHRINEAYDMVMSSLRESDKDESYSYNTKSYEYADDCDEPFRRMNDSTWNLWEEWRGWEGVGIRDYSSHINPYI